MLWSTFRKLYVLEEVSTIWEGDLFNEKEESTSTGMPLGTTIYNIEITFGWRRQLAGAGSKTDCKSGKIGHTKITLCRIYLISKSYLCGAY